MSTAEADRLVGPEVIARQLAVNETTVLRWANQGRIPSIRCTHKVVRFRPADVLAALESKGANGK